MENVECGWMYERLDGRGGSNLNGGAQPEFGYENPYRRMILDIVGPNISQGSSSQFDSNVEPESSHPYEPSMEEEPNLKSQKFYDLLQAANAELYPGSSLFQLAVVSRMLNIKMENSLSHRGYDQMMQLFKELYLKII
uniref:Uncharacterized protein isoform X2 n=1 Tax=Nicotiana tabacum TaxID=4097 RepID=A0A1S3XR74_TOBAC|nr:PREDICTED: uncharacterized protein LOC107767636 isoform X2 [Nicotiana tabacum]